MSSYKDRQRARKAATQAKSPLVAFRVSVAQRAAIRRAARKEGISVSALIRRHIDAVYACEEHSVAPRARTERGQFVRDDAWLERRQAKRSRNSLDYHAQTLAKAQARLKEAANVNRPFKSLADQPRED
jgi:hypothetical protein